MTLPDLFQNQYENYLIMDWDLIITSTLGLITILIVVYWSYKQYKQLQNQLSSSFFAEYTKRYQEIILHLPVSIEKTEFKLEALEKQDKDSCIRYIRVYFDLCSEQHFLFKTKRIDQDIWREWEEGMKHFFSIPSFNEYSDESVPVIPGQSVPPFSRWI